MYQLIVPREEFVAAATKLPKRSPKRIAGSRSSIAPDTQIYRAKGRLVVATPFVETAMAARGRWAVCISVDPNGLANLARSLRDGVDLEVEFVSGQLRLDGGRYCLPAVATVPSRRD